MNLAVGGMVLVLRSDSIDVVTGIGLFTDTAAGYDGGQGLVGRVAEPEITG